MGEGSQVLQSYDYPRLDSLFWRVLAWTTVSTFSCSLLMLPVASVMIVGRAGLQLLGLASWHRGWLYSAGAVVALALSPVERWPWMSSQYQRVFALWNCLFHTKVILPESGAPSGGRPFILTVHPHGIIPLTGCMIWETTRRLGYAAPDYFGGASAALHIPLLRHFLLHNGGVPAGRKDCIRVLRQGYSYSVFSGGVTEMVLSKNSAEVLYLEKRRSIFELAKELGDIPVVPVLAFGASKHFGRWPDDNEAALIAMSRALKASFLLPIGWCGLPIPRWHPVTMVFGPTIDPAIGVKEAHQQWVDWYRTTYAEYRDSAGYSDRPLEVL